MRLWIVLGLLVFASAAHAEGEIERGKAVYSRCMACHSPERNRTGPKHCGLIGRKAGSVPGFRYSKAMREAGLVWNAETLDRFIENPLRTVPGTSMGYAGVKDPRERSALIAYLATLQCP